MHSVLFCLMKLEIQRNITNMLIHWWQEYPWCHFSQLSSPTSPRSLIPLPSVVLSLCGWSLLISISQTNSQPDTLDPGRWSHLQKTNSEMMGTTDWLSSDTFCWCYLSFWWPTLRKLQLDNGLRLDLIQRCWKMNGGLVIHYLDWWPASGPQEVEPIVTLHYLAHGEGVVKDAVPESSISATKQKKKRTHVKGQLRCLEAEKLFSQNLQQPKFNFVSAYFFS